MSDETPSVVCHTGIESVERHIKPLKHLCRAVVNNLHQKDAATVLSRRYT